MKLKDGEYLCDKCNGRGSLPTRNPDVVTKCPKCHGKKKLDWIENIIGVTKNKPEQLDVMKEWVKVAANEFAKKVDEDIIHDLLYGTNDKIESTFRRK